MRGKLIHTPVLCAAALALTACGEDDTLINQVRETRTFTVRIENISTPSTLLVSRLDGVVPLSPGVWIVTDGTETLFNVGAPADAGTERLAEDGDNSVKAMMLDQIVGLQNGTFTGFEGTDHKPTIGPGEVATFTIVAWPGQKLQVMTMFTQSNDWFIAFANGGIALFRDDHDVDAPLSGDVTASLVLYDAGTEDDTAPGTGPNQAPVQIAPNTGPRDENGSIRLAVSHPFTIPALASVLKITITPQ